MILADLSGRVAEWFQQFRDDRVFLLKSDVEA